MLNEIPLPSSITPERVCDVCYSQLLQQYASNPSWVACTLSYFSKEFTKLEHIPFNPWLSFNHQQTCSGVFCLIMLFWEGVCVTCIYLHQIQHHVVDEWCPPSGLTQYYLNCLWNQPCFILIVFLDYAARSKMSKIIKGKCYK